MFQKFFILISVLISFSVVAERISGEGRFYAVEDDSVKFIKKQLLSSAYRDIISQEMQAMGLDHEFFWKNYDQKFDDYFAPIQESLKKKYANEEGEVLENRREDYQKALRVKRLTLKANFGRLSRVISSYSVKKMSRSTQMANSRYIVVSAKVDRKELTKIFDRFTKVNNVRHFKTLYVGVNFVLNSLSWSDLGVDVETDFTKVVVEHWIRKLEEVLDASVEQIVFADKAKVETIQAELNRPGEGGSSVFSSFQTVDNELWLMGEVMVALGENNTLLEKRGYSFSGGVLLYDLNKKERLGHFDFVPEKTSFSTRDKHQLSSHLASLVYRLPLVFFQDVKKTLSRLRADKQVGLIEVAGVKNLSEAYHFAGLLEKKGVIYGITPQIKKVDIKKTQLLISYNGKKEALSDFLRSLNGQKVGGRYEVKLPDEKNPFSFTMISIDGEASRKSL